MTFDELVCCYRANSILGARLRLPHFFDSIVLIRSTFKMNKNWMYLMYVFE
jgi:hypothetical protein